eukprot:TRINITY_DN98053_c0_g1_i1.p1 TRINITY_DN98053_c0_g1~~TRINITY_DN98053_c0_g1_i1.p1  ORF type:complete len:152 (+),score=19.95 TRINITY_DN98053_c0_g1_i1:3-458(+)
MRISQDPRLSDSDVIECLGCLRMLPRRDLEEFEGRCAACGPALPRYSLQASPGSSLLGSQQSTSELETLARGGDSDAAFLLGQAYAHGALGKEVDFKVALTWYRAAAQQGHREAQYALGEAHETKLPLRRDLLEPIRLLRSQGIAQSETIM